jgi:murein DD-endopeptidase MepM/ murein hydrolase activator NlpD
MRVAERTHKVVVAVLALGLASGLVAGAAVAQSGIATQRGLSAPGASSYDEEIAEQEKRELENEQRLKDLENALEDTDEAIVEADREKRELDAQLVDVRAELDLAQQRVDAALVEQQIVANKLEAAQAQDHEISRQIEADEARSAELQKTVAALARDLYRDAGTQGALDVVFGAASASEFTDAFALRHSASRAQSAALEEVEQLAAVNRNRAARQEAVRVRIEELKAEADALVEETTQAKVVVQQKKDQVQGLVDQIAAKVRYLESQRQAALAKQAQIEAQQEATRDKLAELIQKKIEEEAARAENPTPIGKGYLSFPTAVPYITSSYGWRTHPIFGYRKFHYGTDFRAYCGTPLYASASGTVEWASPQGGFGNQVMIDHGLVNGNVLFTSYNHLSSFAVSAGQQVSRGQVIGYSGTTGSSTACHLHFEVYLNGPTVDPISILGYPPS